MNPHLTTLPQQTRPVTQQETETALDGVAAIVPAYNEADNIARTIAALHNVPEIDEILVVDGFSEDDTVTRAERAGARVVEQSEQVYPGKGVALQTGFEETDADVVVCFDADLKNVAPDMPRNLIMPILQDEADHTIGKYQRKAGRVTELTVKPLLRLLFPEVQFQQPLAGEYAFRREVLDNIRLEPGWGLESGIVIDVVMNQYRTTEVELGFKDHAMKDLPELGIMAEQAAATILRKARTYGRL